MLRKKFEIGSNAKVILTIANFRAEKDYPTLLRAAAVVIEVLPSVRFLAVGGGPLEVGIRRCHQSLGLGDRFVFLGPIRDAAKLLPLADVFALSSIIEGYPVSVMEAHCAGLPVVATAVGGMTEAVANGVDGLLVPPSSPTELAGALVAILEDDTLRDRMARASAARGKRYNSRAAASQLAVIYEELL
ncbi:MAG: glycosyltransferase [Acidimicrobiales bacterium]